MFPFFFCLPQDPASQLSLMRSDPDMPLPLVAIPSSDASSANAITGHLGRQGGGTCFVGLNERWESVGLEGFAAQLAALARAAGPDRRVVLEASPDPDDAWVAVTVIPKLPPPAVASAPPAALISQQDPSGEPLPELVDLGPQPLDEATLHALGEHSITGLQRAGAIDAAGRPTIAGAVTALDEDENALHVPALCVKVSRFEHGLAAHSTDASAAEVRLLNPPMARSIPTIAELLILASPALSEQADPARVALSELLVNAIAHRSYDPDQLERFVEVEQFTDAVRISNPGKASPTLTDKNTFLAWPERPNPTLMSLLTRLGLAHGQGIGLATARARTRDAGMRVSLEASDGWVHATLAFAATDETQTHRQPEPPARPRRLRISTDERHRLLVERLEQLGVASSRDLADQLGWPAPTVRAALQQLQEQGRVMQVDANPRSPKQRYRLPDPSDTDN